MGEVVQFPTRNRGRVRKSTGAWAEGIHAMIQFDSRPDNVHHVHESRFDSLARLEMLACGFNLLVQALPCEIQESLWRRVMIEAASDKDPRQRLLAASICKTFNRHRAR